MHYQGTIYRPPSEANSILLQVTTGCSHNKCNFCGMYKGQRFSIKDEQTVLADIAFAAQHYPFARRLFLCDGDALILPQQRLVTILSSIRQHLRQVSRVGVYANTKSLAMKSVADLEALRELGLGILYIGLESGDDHTLEQIGKGADSTRMTGMVRKAKQAGLQVSVTVLLGIAGAVRSDVHAQETGRVLTAMDPDYIGALSLILEPGTRLHAEYEAGRFALPEPLTLLGELRTMIATTHLTGGLFHANHASNYVPIRAKLPEEQAQTLQLLDRALAGKVALKPEYLRAL